MTYLGKLILARLCRGSAAGGGRSPPHEAKTMGPTAAAIVGGVAGLAVGAAIADSANHNKKKIYYNGYAAALCARAPMTPISTRPSAPTAGVVCYPAQRALLQQQRQRVPTHWTRRVYGY